MVLPSFTCYIKSQAVDLCGVKEDEGCKVDMVFFLREYVSKMCLLSTSETRRLFKELRASS